VRRISHDLRPALLDDLGLAAALEHLADEFAQHSGTPVRFSASGATDGLPAVAATVLFRIAQEALTNIERHAGASAIVMALERSGGRVGLVVADDGAGFDAQGIAVHPRRGIGLRNMMERIDAIGGTLRIDSSARGTTVRASVDMTESEQ
jgi:two-component system NarL family sensor kinase